jgi:hypothetical protein
LQLAVLFIVSRCDIICEAAITAGLDTCVEWLVWVVHSGPGAAACMDGVAWHGIQMIMSHGQYLPVWLAAALGRVRGYDVAAPGQSAVCVCWRWNVPLIAGAPLVTEAVR